MKLGLISAVLLIVLAECTESCEPYGVRTFFGGSYTTPNHPELFSLRFNTNSSCEASFVRTLQGSNAQDFPCSVTKITVKNLTTFITYVHNCSLTNLASG